MQLEALDKVLNDAFPVEDESRTLYVSWASITWNCQFNILSIDGELSILTNCEHCRQTFFLCITFHL